MLYLLPAAVWAIGRLWSNRRSGWKIDLGWMSAAVAVPFAVTLWWLHFADATKAKNPLAKFIVSENLTEFNFGTHAMRFSVELWQTKFRLIVENLTAWPVLVAGALLLAGPARRRWREAGACVVWFMSVLFVFPVLYAVHDYYYAANTVLLLAALGLVVVALAESQAARWIKVSVLLVVLIAQGWRYLEHYYPSQSAVSIGGDGLTRSLQAVTQPQDVIVVLGQDWSSITPYYARRKAVMLRDDAARDSNLVEQALVNLDGEKIGALVIVGKRDGEEWLIDRAEARGLSRRPTYLWHDARVFLPRERETEVVEVLLKESFPGVSIAPGVNVPKRDHSNRWVNYADLWPWERAPFEAMTPKPVRFFSQFGPAADGSRGVLMFGGHPETRLVFALPAGEHVLRGSLQLGLDTYRSDLKDNEATDGVEITLSALEPDGSRRVLGTRYFDPRRNLDDRGERRPLTFAFRLDQAGEVELALLPGPAGNFTRDWIEVGPLVIE